MSVQILIFMRIALGKNDEVFEKLKRIPQIKEIYFITGKYDLAFILEEESPEAIHDLFIEQIDCIDGILKSNSHLLMRRWRRA